MEGLRQYLLGVIVASTICGIVLSLFPEGRLRRWLQLVCGTWLAVTLLAPVEGGSVALRLPSFPDFRGMADQQSAAGQEMAASSQRAIIKESLEAYVLDKAQTQGVTLSVEITLSGENPPVPASAVLRGKVTKEAERVLSGILERDLGIPKEAQTWIGGA